MYGVVPSKRGQGYGTIICKLLLEKMGYKKAIVTCDSKNRWPSKIIQKNNVILFETKKDIEGNMIKRYRIHL